MVFEGCSYYYDAYEEESFPLYPRCCEAILDFRTPFTFLFLAYILILNIFPSLTGLLK